MIAHVSHPLVSLGYEGRDVAELVSQLEAAGVSALVDVRLNAVSRKPGMSKKRLAAALGEAGIAYVHLPDLGNPRDNRDPFRAGDPRSVQRYRQLLLAEEAQRSLTHVAELLDEGAVALLCFERDHTTCHRQVVTGELQRAAPDLRVVHL